MFRDLLPGHWLTLHGLAVSLAVLVYIFSSHLMRQRRPPASAIAWVLFIVLLPYVALRDAPGKPLPIVSSTVPSSVVIKMR